MHPLLKDVELERKDLVKLAGICVNWSTYVCELATCDRDTVLKLMKYLLKYRSKNRTFLERAVSRFNTLNRLLINDLYCWKEANCEREEIRSVIDKNDTE